MFPKVGSVQAVKAMGLEGPKPGKELLLRKLVAAARFFESDFAVPHSSNDCGFAARHPSFGVRRWQLIHGRCSDQIRDWYDGAATGPVAEATPLRRSWNERGMPNCSRFQMSSHQDAAA